MNLFVRYTISQDIITIFWYISDKERFVGQGDIYLSDKGTFICRTRGHFFVGQGDIYLSDKGTFFCRTRGHLVKTSLWPQQARGQDINFETVLKPEDKQSQPTCKVSSKLVQ